MPKPRTGAVVVLVDNGYDLHRLITSRRTLAQIQTGKRVTIEGQGFLVEGVMELDEWAFNHGALGAILRVHRHGPRSVRGQSR